MNYLISKTHGRTNVTEQEAREAFKKSLIAMSGAADKPNMFEITKEHGFWCGFLHECDRRDIINEISFQVECEKRGVFFTPETNSDS